MDTFGYGWLLACQNKPIELAVQMGKEALKGFQSRMSYNQNNHRGIRERYLSQKVKRIQQGEKEQTHGQ